MTAIPGADAGAMDVVLGVDGTVTAVGGYRTPAFQTGFVLARYTPDGALDRRFGVGGIVRTPWLDSPDSGGWDTASMAGKIVVGGQSHVARYGRSGKLDESFAAHGVLPTGARAIALLPSGRVASTGSRDGRSPT